jgi:hypothetical protein
VELLFIKTIPFDGYLELSIVHYLKKRPGVAQWLRHCATSRDRFPVVSHWGFFSVATDGTMCPGVYSASKNEYQGFPLGVKAAGA